MSIEPVVLIVDDDPMIRLNAQDILEAAGFHCLDAIDAQAAIAELDHHGQEIVLLFSDVEMPGGMDGFALARLVANAWPHIEIVIVSGRRRPEPGDMPDRATFLTKPFSQASVLEHLANTLPDGKKPDPLRRVG